MFYFFNKKESWGKKNEKIQCQCWCWDASPEISKWPLFKFLLRLFLTHKWLAYIVKTAKFCCFIQKPYFAAFQTQPKSRENFMLPKFLAAQSRWNFKNCGHTFLSYLKHYSWAKAVFKTWFPPNRWPIDIYKMLIQRILFIYIPSIKTEWIVPSQRIDFSKIIVYWY